MFAGEAGGFCNGLFGRQGWCSPSAAGWKAARKKFNGNSGRGIRFVSDVSGRFFLCLCQTEHSGHRSVINFLVNISTGLAAYSICQTHVI